LAPYRGNIVKILNFSKTKMAAAAILKTVKSLYLLNRLTDFDEIWHGDAYWPSTGDRPLKFRIFKNQDGGGRHLEKPQKSRYHNNGLTGLREIWRIMQNGSLNLPDRYKM